MKQWICALWLGLGSCVVAAEVMVTDATVREMLPGRSMTAGYFSISNKSAAEVELISASSPAFGSIELHQHSHKDGMMKMEQVSSVKIAAGEAVLFQPGALHLMLFDAKTSITKGQKIPLRLEFKDGQSIDIQAEVSAIPTH
ncbi:MAG: copper chaperone PCu(A)C [Gammaproteobacteria bacterium]|nr:copper chaperone PCu(A)C [Gammaproteobacteria bacterium]MBU2056559.1 copper chaperone PCu(A)C [Gammaproteobacteria bacterium]MBU2174178.1 copper chaperone PCu(A)C [Gammaproteobacteria bacterium]MBU2248771.1 copper chaperone PCu(A)C [Gammaproteobacteria bacterium]MBU2344049.1 copper chaperone PCu(A)C [Gammaproteobacteria bacterium]